MRNTLFNKMNFVIIGEIKLASPSAGVLGQQEDIEARAIAYAHAGVGVISVVTESKRFGGNPSFIPRIRKATLLPILQKDFVVREKQIYESKSLGADALLLIAQIIDTSTLKKFVRLCQKVHLEPVVEIHTQEDLKKAVATSTTCIAVNARNLQTLTVDVENACKLIQKIPKHFIKLGFSGIHSRVEVKKYKDAGAQGVLIGTSLMKAHNIKVFVKTL